MPQKNQCYFEFEIGLVKSGMSRVVYSLSFSNVCLFLNSSSKRISGVKMVAFQPFATDTIEGCCQAVEAAICGRIGEFRIRAGCNISFGNFAMEV